jgi:DNA-binding FrmR family transcriptional regulator
MSDIEQEIKASRELLLRRLKRVEGQIRGIQKMIAEDRDCVSLIVQLAAVRSGIEGAGALVLNNYMRLCFHKGPNAESDMKSLARAISVWGRVRGGDLEPQ